MDPHELPANQKRAGKLPSQIIEELQEEKSQEEDKKNSSEMVSNKFNSTN